MTDPTQPAESRSLPGVSGEWIGLLELNPDALLILDRNGRVVFANPSAEELFGMARERLLGTSLVDGRIPLGPKGGPAFDADAHPLLRFAREGCEPQTLELGLLPADAMPRVLSCAIAEMTDTGGGEPGLIAAIRDVSEVHRVSAHERIIAEAGRILVSSLDVETALAGVARAVVPGLAEGCAMHLRSAGGPVRCAAAAGLPPDPDATVIAEVLADGQAFALRRRSTEGGSRVVLPLIARGNTLGAIELRMTCAVEPAELDLAERLAQLVALAVDNERLRQAAQRAQAEATAQVERAATILESITDAFWAVDRDGRVTYVNHRAEMVLGHERDDIIGRPIGDLLRAPFRARMQEEMRRVRADQEPRQFEVEAPNDDSWLEVHIYPAADGLSVYLHDISVRRRSADAQRLLIETGAALATSLDSEETLTFAAQAAIPTLGDVCTVDLIGGDQGITRVAFAARDGAAKERLRRLSRRFPPDRALPSATMRAIRTGDAVVVNDIAREGALPHVPDPELLRLQQELGATAALVSPLVARGRRMGVITFAFTRSGRRYTAELQRLAEDVSRRAAIALDNARLYEEAQESSRAKSNFISVMSHEFRTPLTAIVGYADLLNAQVAGPLTEGQRQQLDRIKESAWHLTQLIEEVLTFSRVEAGRETISAEVVDLAQVAAKAAALIEPQAHEKNLRLEVDLPSHPLLAHTDSGKVSQILLNLLGNAVKFTNAGTVGLRVWHDGTRYLFRVADTGIGIAPENRQRIFDSFWQAEQGTTRSVTGTGLGLTITRRLAHLLGGDVEVTSEVGHGSVFTAWLPTTEKAAARPVEATF